MLPRQLRKLEEEIECMRAVLYRAVDGTPSRLTDSDVLPLSMFLDHLIVELQKSKQ